MGNKGNPSALEHHLHIYQRSNVVIGSAQCIRVCHVLLLPLLITDLNIRKISALSSVYVLPDIVV